MFAVTLVGTISLSELIAHCCFKVSEFIFIIQFIISFTVYILSFKADFNNSLGSGFKYLFTQRFSHVVLHQVSDLLKAKDVCGGWLSCNAQRMDRQENIQASAWLTVTLQTFVEGRIKHSWCCWSEKKTYLNETNLYCVFQNCCLFWYLKLFWQIKKKKTSVKYLYIYWVKLQSGYFWIALFL